MREPDAVVSWCPLLSFARVQAGHGEHAGWWVLLSEDAMAGFALMLAAVVAYLRLLDGPA